VCAQESVDGGCAHLDQSPLGVLGKPELTLPLQHSHNLSQERLQALGADPVAGFPDRNQSSLHIVGVLAWTPSPIPGLRLPTLA